MSSDDVMIRQSALKNAVATVDIEQRTGYFEKISEDVPARINLWYNKYLEWIMKGVPVSDGFQTPVAKPDAVKPKPKEQHTDQEHIAQQTIAGEPRDATEGMKRAIWAITFGDDGTEERVAELEAKLEQRTQERDTVTAELHRVEQDVEAVEELLDSIRGHRKTEES